jgi:hypothetical protein
MDYGVFPASRHFGFVPGGDGDLDLRPGDVIQLPDGSRGTYLGPMQPRKLYVLPTSDARRVSASRLGPASPHPRCRGRLRAPRTRFRAGTRTASRAGPRPDDPDPDLTTSPSQCADGRVEVST